MCLGQWGVEAVSYTLLLALKCIENALFAAFKTQKNRARRETAELPSPQSLQKNVITGFAV